MGLLDEILNRPWRITHSQSEKDGQWYCHILSANGEITWDTEGFSSESHAIRAMHRLLRQIKLGEFLLDCDTPPEEEPESPVDS